MLEEKKIKAGMRTALQLGHDITRYQAVVHLLPTKSALF
jgi:hypothetical protein